MTTPPPLNGQILSPAYPHPIGGETRVIYVNAPNNNLARAGSDLIRNLTFGGGGVLAALVIATAILPEPLKPAHLIGSFKADERSTYLRETRQDEVDTQAALGLGQTKTQADTLCAGSRAAATTLSQHNGQDWLPLANVFRDFSCAFSNNLGALQKADR